MTRILDALKKVQAARPATVQPITPLPSVPGPATALPGATTARAVSAGRTAGTRVGRPLVAVVELGDEIERQMISLRVSLESALGDRSPRIVIFHGAQSGEGSSTVVQQFCSVLAHDGAQRVLLVDAHVERPSLVADEKHGVTVCALRGPRGPAGAEGAGTRNLDALPVPEAYRSGRIYPTEAARDLLESVAGVYDWIVLDGPPVLEAPDAAALASIADGAVMVVRAGRTKRPVLARAVDVLRKGGGRVIGSVLNGRQLEIPEFIYRRL